MQSAKLLNLNIAREKFQAGSAMPLLLDHRRSCIGKPTIVKNSSRLSALVTVLRRRLPTKKTLNSRNLFFKLINAAKHQCCALKPSKLPTQLEDFFGVTKGNAHA